jgi:hypothetical protein
LLNHPFIQKTIISKELIVPDCLKEKMKMESEKEEKSIGLKKIVKMNNEGKKRFEREIEKLMNKTNELEEEKEKKR